MSPALAASDLSQRAAGVLRQVFSAIPAAFAFRLWDGTVIALGAGPAAFTVVIHSADAFLRLMRDPTPLAFGEAFVSGAIDIEGDLFAAMRIANSIEDLRVSALDRWRLVVALVRG